MKNKMMLLSLMGIMVCAQYLCYFQNPFVEYELPFLSALTDADTASGNMWIVLYAYVPIPFFLLLFSSEMKGLISGYGILLSIRGEKKGKTIIKLMTKTMLSIYILTMIIGILYMVGKKSDWGVLESKQAFYALVLYAFAICVMVQLEYLLELHFDVQYAWGIVAVSGVLMLFLSGSSGERINFINWILFPNLGFARKNGVIPCEDSGITPMVAFLILFTIHLVLLGFTLKTFKKKDMI